MATVKLNPSVQGKTYEQLTPEELAGYDQMLAYLQKLPMGSGYDASMELQKKMTPTYKRNKAYDENIALARTNLYAPDREAQIARTDIDEGTADAIGRAREFAGSTSSLLDTLATLNTGRNKALRGLTQDQAAIRQQKLATLMGANVMSAEEDDKAWNYNVNQPYQNRVQETVDREKWRRENESNALDTILAIGSSFIPGIGNAFGKKKQSNVQPSYSEGAG